MNHTVSNVKNRAPKKTSTCSAIIVDHFGFYRKDIAVVDRCVRVVFLVYSVLFIIVVQYDERTNGSIHKRKQRQS